MARKTWAETVREDMARNPEMKAAYDAERARVDAAWEVICREGNCLYYVLPDGDIGGIGVPGCPCERND